MKIFKFVLILVAINTFILANPNIESTKISQSDIRIDGILNEDIWQKVKSYNAFYTFQPVYGNEMSKETIVYLAYDEKNLYFAFRCLDPEPEKIVGSLTKRDNIFSEDWVMVMLDSYNDMEGCYEFGVNSYGVQGDLMFNGQNDDPSHDFIWESAGIKTSEGYNVEIAIPLKSIRFQPAEFVEMGICFLRFTPLTSEKGSFPQILPEGGSLLNQFGKVKFENLSYERNIEILPSVTRNQKYAQKIGDLKQDFIQNDFGITAKVGLTPTLTMDATYNPDFSQIEADAGRVTANLRTDIYYREKRPFFLEGSEKFNLAGARHFSSIIKPVHTRNIIDPIAGLKLSGKIGNNGSISTLIAADESPKNDEDLINENAFHGIFRYKNLLKNGSYFGGLYSTKFLGEENIHSMAADYKYHINGKNKIETNAIVTVHNENSDMASKQSHNIDLEYVYDDEFNVLSLSVHEISKDFLLSSGFVGRDGLTTLSGFGFRNFIPDNSFFKKLEFGFIGDVRKDNYDNKYEYFSEISTEYYLPRNTFFTIKFNYSTEVYNNEIYRNDEVGSFFRTQILKQLNINGSIHIGKATWYDEDEPQQAFRNVIDLGLNFKPNSNFQSSFNITRSYYENFETKKELMDYQIFRNRTTYQINKYLFFRSTVEYNAYDNQLLTDFLVSFTYIPGTVIHVGYGSMYEQIRWDKNQREYHTDNKFLEMERGLFMKASYNWRL